MFSGNQSSNGIKYACKASLILRYITKNPEQFVQDSLNNYMK